MTTKQYVNATTKMQVALNFDEDMLLSGLYIR